MNRAERRTKENKDELVEILASRCVQEGRNPIFDGLNFYKHSECTEPTYAIHPPSICLVAQGAKVIQAGELALRYDATNFLLCSVDLPVVAQVVEGSVSQPYYGVKLDLDTRLVTNVMVETELPPIKAESSINSLGVSSLTGEVLDAFVRVLRLSQNPNEYLALAPLAMRELVYRLLTSADGARLRQIAIFGGNAHKITQAVGILQARLSASVNMEDLASELGMSISSFHQHFKSVTSMSPLQFQKFLRLQEARQLLLSEDLDANEVASRVGYDDPSQFNREYKRRFGEPPKRDAQRYKQVAALRSN